MIERRGKDAWPEREAMLFPFRWIECLRELDSGDRWAMIEAIGAYASRGEAPKFAGAMAALWVEFRRQIDFDVQRYAEICRRNRENGQKGGRPSKNPEKPRKPSGIFENPENPEKPDKDKDNDKDKDEDEDEEREGDSLSPARDDYPQSVEDVLKIAEDPRCGMECTSEQAEKYFVTRDTANWVDACGRRIRPGKVYGDLKRWLLRDQRDTKRPRGAGEGDWRV
ncbi:MAG: hypothetical protein IJT50_12490 [Lentisphaeria bacterium]|nr:hypothetical protein [Lentisphaeria bacterium]